MTTSIDWGTCPPIEQGTRDPRQVCGTLRVPLDYRAPRGDTIEIAVSRIATAKAGTKRGILLVNPGGPGGRGLDFPNNLLRAFPAEVLDRYDLVGFDPRGVGHSTPVSCGFTVDDANTALFLPYPSTDGNITRNVAFARRAAATCATRSGKLLPYLTTANTARDMDRIRAALNAGKLSYFGVSYGTYLGAVYATMFEKRTDRVILDSAVDPTRIWYDIWRTWSRGVADRFPDAANYAARQDQTLGFGTTTPQVTASYLALARQLDAKPMPMPSLGIRFSGNMLREITRSYLYSDSLLPALIKIWAEASGHGSATGAPTLTAALRRFMSTATTGVPADNGIAALYAVVCDDVQWRSDVPLYQANVQADRVVWPLTAGMPSNLWPCAFWNYRPIESPVTITGRGQRNVLVLQNRRDPATPWESGLGLRRALGHRAALIAVDAGGHGAYGWNSCADIATRTLLVDGALPSHDVSCPKPTNSTLPLPAVAPPSRIPPLLGW